MIENTNLTAPSAALGLVASEFPRECGVLKDVECVAALGAMPALMRVGSAAAQAAPTGRGGHALKRLALAAHPQAVCNDGSTAAYFYRKASSHPKSWLVYLEGAGICYDETSCTRRCSSRSNPLCSSHTWRSSQQVDGFLRASSSDLGGAHKVLVRYCSSDAFLGNSSAFGLQFRGQAIIEAVFSELVGTHGLGRARKPGRQRDTVVFGGSSSGAYGAMAHLDFVPRMLGASAAANVRVVGFLDAALTLMPPWQPADGEKRLRLGQREKLMDSYLHSTRHGDACTSSLPQGSDQRFKCLLALYRLRHLNTPFLLVASQFDTAQVATLLSSALGERPQGKNEEDVVQQFAKRHVREALKVQSAAAQRNVSVGLFMPACFDHATAGSENGFQYVRHSLDGESMQGALLKLMNPRTARQSSLTFVDQCEGFACGSCPSSAADSG